MGVGHGQRRAMSLPLSLPGVKCLRDERGPSAMSSIVSLGLSSARGQASYRNSKVHCSVPPPYHLLPCCPTGYCIPLVRAPNQFSDNGDAMELGWEQGYFLRGI
jgi:hypothetical protein